MSVAASESPDRMILCCGEALIDMVPVPAKDGRRVFAPHAGGAALNTAIALARLGTPAGLLAGLSHDPFGRMIEDILRNDGVDLRFVIRSGRPTTLAFSEIVDGHARYSFHDENSAGRMLSGDDMPDLPAAIAALHLSGISLVQEPCGSTFEALMARERSRRLLYLDPNIRPVFIADRAAHLARMGRMTGMADIVKVSLEDLDWLEPGVEPDAVAGRWLDGSAVLVIVTMGNGGAMAFRKSGDLHVPSPSVEVRDTIGAGDTFSAALLAKLDEAGMLARDAVRAMSSDQLRGMLDYATVAAAISVSRHGASPPTRAEIANFVA